MKVRRRARAAALQALYEIDSAQHDPGVVLAQRLAEARLSAEGERFARALVSGILGQRQQIDALIQRHAPEWPVDQMANIDRNVLRIAIYEFAVAAITPTRVAINEAIELAKLYGSESAPRFVNGVLGSLAAIPTASSSHAKAS
ncbi:MAG: transcription antitermination factor NusB [Anaerolineae bacterium]